MSPIAEPPELVGKTTDSVATAAVHLLNNVWTEIELGHDISRVGKGPLTGYL
jgi:hypothetical protein